MGAMLRAKCLWTEEGEKNTSYFLRLEKRNYANKVITQLLVEDQIISNAKEILKAEKCYYEKKVKGKQYRKNISRRQTMV